MVSILAKMGLIIEFPVLPRAPNAEVCECDNMIASVYIEENMHENIIIERAPDLPINTGSRVSS